MVPKPTAIDTEPRLDEAVALHRQGQLGQAKALYQEILKLRPADAGALHLLGVIAIQEGNHQSAAELIASAIEIAPDNAMFYSNQSLALQELKQFDAAIASCDRAIAIQPDYADAYCNRGAALQALGQLEAALLSYDRALAIQPDYAEAHCNRGTALQALGRLLDALASFDEALAVKPDYAGAHYNRGRALRQLGRFDAAIAGYRHATAHKPDLVKAHLDLGHVLKDLNQFEAAIASYDQVIEYQPRDALAFHCRAGALRELERFDAAICSYDQAIALNPDYAEAFLGRGISLNRLKQLDAALASCERAIALRPDFAVAYSDRGNVLKDLKRFDAALASYDHAIALKPDYAAAYSNRGNAFKELGQFGAALASYDQAIALQSEFADAIWNKSLVLLMTGDFERGWDLYEWRWKWRGQSKHKREFAQPLWLGTESLKGKTILLHCEQGFGDILQFCRFAKSVAALGARVTIEVHPALLGLLYTLAGVTELIVEGDPLPNFDYHCPLLSLPLALKTTIATIPCTSSYLRSDATKVAYWANRLGPKTKLRVGIAWSGRPDHTNDHNRSIPLSEFMRRMPQECEYVSLQNQVRDEDRRTLGVHPAIRHFGDQIDDFSDTAALCELMDVVISVDTSVAHLSGALGKPTWILLPYVPDWRWLLNRTDSPWYSSAKLYRQAALDNWESVFKSVAADLAALYA